ncbi:hypothetical protein COLO4_29007 [Corchorus olitorius]|uniref:Uncharacterized protein n=1 Tax=Corchorus olitorius TaxID=93759 RepID=A0A1R3HH02_9ROSI|nr:hypothetical protein COLO4_29007 [Corchorus olitorius]
MDKKPCKSQDVEVRKGPWTMEEDLILINYIANHGEGVWNSLAKAAAEQASTNQMGCSTADFMEAYSPDPSFNQCNNNNNNNHHNHMEASFQGQPSTAMSMAMAIDSNESYWSMEDLWSMQLLNGD